MKWKPCTVKYCSEQFYRQAQGLIKRSKTSGKVPRLNPKLDDEYTLLWSRRTGYNSFVTQMMNGLLSFSKLEHDLIFPRIRCDVCIHALGSRLCTQLALPACPVVPRVNKVNIDEIIRPLLKEPTCYAPFTHLLVKIHGSVM